VRLGVPFVAAFSTANAQGVIGEAVGEFRDGRGHGANDAVEFAYGPYSGGLPKCCMQIPGCQYY
jgi:hypothetical protein